MCIDEKVKLESINELIFQSQENMPDRGEFIQFFLQKCEEHEDGEQNQNKNNCKSAEEIKDFLDKNIIMITIKTYLKEYNTKNQTLELKPKINHIILGNQTLYQTYNFQKTVLKVNRGLLGNQEQNYSYMETFTIDKQLMITDRYSNFLGAFAFYIQSEEIDLIIQYPSLYDILPQVNSVFTVLCFLGVFSSYLSEALIFQDILEIYLKHFYQRENHNLTKYNKLQKDKLKISSFKSLWWYFKQFYFDQGRRKYIKKSSKLSNSSSDSDKDSIDVYRNVFQEVKDNVELTNIFRELMELKNCIHFLFTEEQYAAIKQCGRNLPSLKVLKLCQQQIQNIQTKDKDNKLDVENLEKLQTIYKNRDYKKMNHLEKMNLIDKNQVLQEQLYSKFKQDYFNKDIDLLQQQLKSRINNSLIDKIQRDSILEQEVKFRISDTSLQKKHQFINIKQQKEDKKEKYINNISDMGASNCTSNIRSSQKLENYSEELESNDQSQNNNDFEENSHRKLVLSFFQQQQQQELGSRIFSSNNLIFRSSADNKLISCHQKNKENNVFKYPEQEEHDNKEIIQQNNTQ